MLPLNDETVDERGVNVKQANDDLIENSTMLEVASLEVCRMNVLWNLIPILLSHYAAGNFLSTRLW